MKLETRNMTLLPLFPIDGGRHGLKGVIHPLETFGMSDEEMASRLEIPKELVDEFFLRGAVEINHHVSAKDQIQRALNGKLLVH